MTWYWWLILVGGGAVLGVLSWQGYRLRRRREVVRRLMRTLYQHTPLQEAELRAFPTLTLNGWYYGYFISIGCKEQEGRLVWRVHTELAQAWAGRLTIVGESRPGRMRELYGQEVLLSGDRDFDRLFLVATNDEALMHRVLTTYVRERFRALRHHHLQIEIQQQAVYAECVTTADEALSIVPMHLEVLLLLCGVLDVANGA